MRTFVLPLGFLPCVSARRVSAKGAPSYNRQMDWLVAACFVVGAIVDKCSRDFERQGTKSTSLASLPRDRILRGKAPTGEADLPVM